MLKKIASNTLSQVFSKGVTAIISIFLISALTKYLSPEMYGQYNKIYNYLAIFTFLADLGLYTISVREISKDKTQAAKIVGNVMSLRMILGLGIIILSCVGAVFLPGYNSTTALISVFIISVFSVISLMNSSVLSLMQAYMKIEFSSLSFIMGKIVNLFLILGVIFILFPKDVGQNYDGAFLCIMLSGLFGIMINFLMNFYYARKIVQVGFLFDWEYIKHIFKISLPNGIALFLSVVYLKVDVILISLIESGKQADISIALYSLPMKIIEVLMVISIFFLNSILPSLSESFEKKDMGKITQILKHSFLFLFSFGIIVLILGVLLGKDMLGVIATKDYLDGSLHIYTAYDAFVVVLFVLVFNFLSSVFNYIFIASKTEKNMVIINTIVTGVNIIGNIIFIPIYSFLGAAIVTGVSQVLLFLLGYYFSRKIVRVEFDFYKILQISIIGVLVYFLISFLMKQYSFGSIGNILLYGGGGILVYSFILFSFYKRELLKK